MGRDTVKQQQPIVEIRHFRMAFGDKMVIQDLSFEVRRGEVFGFLGSNGSGKTTTLRALLGLYEPAGGELLVDGKPVQRVRYNQAMSRRPIRLSVQDARFSFWKEGFDSPMGYNFLTIKICFRNGKS